MVISPPLMTRPHQEYAVGKADGAGEREQVLLDDERLVVKGHDRLRLRPGVVASTLDAPERVKPTQRLLDRRHNLGLEPLLDFVHHASECRINTEVIAMMGAVEVEVVAELLRDRDKGDRKVVVDVRVHPGDRELKRCNARLEAPFEQWRPHARYGALGGGGLDSFKVEV